MRVLREDVIGERRGVRRGDQQRDEEGTDGVIVVPRRAPVRGFTSLLPARYGCLDSSRQLWPSRPIISSAAAGPLVPGS